MRQRSIFAEFISAFPAVAGPRFWLHVRRLIALLVLFAVFRSVVLDCSTVPSGSMIPTLLVGDRVLVNKLAYDLKLPFTTLHLLHWADPKRGDVIVFFSPADGLRLVKRVVAVPGDIVQLRDNVLYLNGIAARYKTADPAGLELITSPRSGRPGGALLDVAKACPCGATATREERDDVMQPALDPGPDDRNQHRVLIESPPAGGAAHPILETPAIPARRSFGPVTIAAGHYFVMGDNRDDSLDSRYFGTVDRSSIVGRTLCVAFSMGPSILPRKARFLMPIN